MYIYIYIYIYQYIVFICIYKYISKKYPNFCVFQHISLPPPPPPPPCRQWRGEFRWWKGYVLKNVKIWILFGRWQTKKMRALLGVVAAGKCT